MILYVLNHKHINIIVYNLCENLNEGNLIIVFLIDKW